MKAIYKSIKHPSLREGLGGLLLLFVSMLLGSCETKKQVVETSSTTVAQQAETTSVNLSERLDSLLLSRWLTIDRIVVEDVLAPEGGDSLIQVVCYQHDTACIAKTAFVPRQKRVTISGLSLTESREQKHKDIARADTTSLSKVVIQEDRKTEKSKKSPGAVCFWVILLLVVAVGAFLYFGVYRRWLR